MVFAFFSLATLILLIGGSGRGEEPSGEKSSAWSESVFPFIVLAFFGSFS
jgi:hypothetical protein